MTTSTTTIPYRTVADLVDALGGVSPSRILVDPPPGTANEEDLLRVSALKIVRCELLDETLVAKDFVPELHEGGLETLGHVVDRLGNVPLDRIRLDPPLGTATEEDLVRVNTTEESLVELVDGILVEKPMGAFESQVAAALIGFLEAYLAGNNLGYTSCPDGSIRLKRRNRLPDVAFFRWARTPHGRVEREAVSSIVPDLAVEVLSPGNTAREIESKRNEYFESGVEAVWVIEPELWTVEIWTDPERCEHLTIDDVLTGGTILPGFELPVRKLAERSTGPGLDPCDD